MAARLPLRVICTHYRAAALLSASHQLAVSIRAAKRFRGASAEFGPKQASLMSGSRFPARFLGAPLGAPLSAEPRRRIAGDRRAMAKPGSIE
jgi:hypothetical protein